MQLQTTQQNTAIEAYSPDQILQQVALIQKVMKSAMQLGSHYGTVPGCGDKPTLLKPGAEKLLFLFHYGTEVDTEVMELGKGHREYRVKVKVFRQSDGLKIGQGVGSCSTLEGKYRYRSENTGKPVPSAYWDSKDPSLLGGPTFKHRKVDGKWMIFQQVEYENPADYYNTCLKMAKKRAMVDATLTSTAASDIFTQDIEDIQENLKVYTNAVDAEVIEEDASFEVSKPQAAPAQAPRPAPVRPVEQVKVETPKPAPAAPQPAQGGGSWRDVIVHFGKNKGLTLGQMEEKSLRWYIDKWEPGDWPKGSGQFKEVDIQLRMALNAAEAELNGGAPAPVESDEIPMEFSNA